MRLFCFLLLLAVTGVYCQVRVLNTDEVIDYLLDGNTEETFFVKFYSPNCGFCNGMQQNWIEFERFIREDNLDLVIAEVNTLELEREKDSRIGGILPGGLPGLHLFLPKEKTFYEYPFARLGQKPESYLEWALDQYQKTTPTYKDIKDFYATKPHLHLIENIEQWDKMTSTEDGEYFIMIFGPRCGWCKHFLPTWEEFAKIAKDRGITATIGWSNGSSNRALTDRYNCRPWPSIFYWKNGNYYRMDTEDVRQIEDPEALVNWILSEEYLKLDEEHSGVDETIAKRRKIEELKEKSRKRKMERTN